MRYLVFLFFLTNLIFAQQQSIYIKSVDVKGMTYSNKFIVLNNMGLKKGGTFNPSVVANGIKFLYHSNLFKNITVFANPNATRDSMDIVVIVQENPKIDNIEFVGNKKLSDKVLKDTIPLKKDSYLTDYNLYKSNKIIIEKYKDKGYNFIDITNSLDFLNDTSRVNVTFKIVEGKKVRVKEIVFEGNKYIEDSKLKSLMETKENKFWRFWGTDYKLDTLKNDLEKIKRYYKRKGLLDITIKDYNVKFNEEKEAIITVNINEGKRYYFGECNFKGNSLYKKDDLLKAIDLKKGDEFDVDKFKKAKMSISNLYSEKGYLYARVEAVKDIKDTLVNLEFVIDEGIPAYVHRVIIKNNTKTKDYVIRREIAIKPGEIYKQSKIFLSYQRIAQLNFFKNVIPDVVPYDSNSVDIVFSIEEKENGQISAGLEYSQYGLGGTLNLSMPNFLGGGQYFGVNVEYGSNKKYYSIGFTEPWFMNTKNKTSLGFNLYHENVNYDDNSGISYNRLRNGGSISSSRRLNWPDNFFTVSATYSLEQQKYSDLSEEAQLYYSTDKVLQSKLGLGIIRDNTDWPQFPTSGSAIGYYPELSGKFLGGQKHYFKQTFLANLYFPSFWKFVLSVKSKLSILNELSGNSSSNNIASEYYWIGGNSYDGILRGYSDNIFGPGRAMYVTRVNYRFPAVERMLYVGVFGDFGNVYDDISKVNFSDLKKSVGIGARMIIPGLGLMGVDFGWGLDKYDSNRNGIIDNNDNIGGYNYTIQINQTF